MNLRKVMDQRKFASWKFFVVEGWGLLLNRYQDLDQGCPLSIIPRACEWWLIEMIEMSKLSSNAQER